MKRIKEMSLPPRESVPSLLPIRNEAECVDALSKALDDIFPDLDVPELIVRLIAKFPFYRKCLAPHNSVREDPISR